MNNLGDVVSYFESIDSKYLYGYCACPIALANEQITGQNHRYHLTMIQPDTYVPPMDNCVVITTYGFCLDELVAFIRQTDDVILSINQAEPFKTYI